VLMIGILFVLVDVEVAPGCCYWWIGPGFSLSTACTAIVLTKF
jgi:hypothetical protein